MTNPQTPMDVNQAVVDTPLERFLLFYAQRKWGKVDVNAQVNSVSTSSRYDEEFDGNASKIRQGDLLFGPLAGWGRHTPVSLRNTRTARRYDPGFPYVIATGATLLTSPIVLFFVVFGVISLVLPALLYGTIWGCTWYITKANRENPARAANFERFRRHRTWSLAMYHAGFLDASASRGSRVMDPKKISVVDDINFEPLGDLIDQESELVKKYSPTGYLVHLPVPATMTPEQIRDKIQILQNATQVPYIEFVPTERSMDGSSSSYATFKVVSLDLGAAATDFTPAIMKSAKPGKIQVGYDATGRTVRLDMSDQHSLIAGGTGSGKTSLAHAILLQLLGSGAIGYLADLKFGDGIQAYAQRGVAKSYATTLAELDQTAAEVAQIVKRRFQREDMDRTPVFLFIDEINAVGIDSKDPDSALKGSILASLKVVLTQGRGVGVTLIAAGQHIDSKTIPTMLRGQFMSRILMRTQESTAIEMVLGGAPADKRLEIERVMGGEGLPGACFVQISGGRIVSTRTSRVETNPAKNQRGGSLPEMVVSMVALLPQVDADFQSALTQEYDTPLSPQAAPLVDEFSYVPAHSAEGREMAAALVAESELAWQTGNLYASVPPPPELSISRPPLIIDPDVRDEDLFKDL